MSQPTEPEEQPPEDWMATDLETEADRAPKLVYNVEVTPARAPKDQPAPTA